MSARPGGRGRPPRGRRGDGRSGPGGQEGQAAVEVALLLPLVVTLLLTVFQVALVARDQVLVVHAAREGARAAAVDRTPGAARAAALAGSGLAADRLTVVAAEQGNRGTVEVNIGYRAATIVPIVGTLLPDVVLGAKAAMRPEW